MLHELQIHVQNKHCRHFKTSSFRMVCYTALDNQTRDRMSISSSKYHQWKEYLWSSNIRASLVAQTVKHLSAMQETQVWSLVWEDPLKKEMAAHSSILAWRIPWTEKPGRLQSTGLQRVGHDWATSLSFLSHEHFLFTSPAGMQGKDTCPQQMSWKRIQNRADCQKAKLGSSVLLIPFFVFFWKDFKIMKSCRNENQNYNHTSAHTGKNGLCQKVYKQ